MGGFRSHRGLELGNGLRHDRRSGTLKSRWLLGQVSQGVVVRDYW